MASSAQAPMGSTAEGDRQITYEPAGPNDLMDLVRVCMEPIEATDMDRVWFWDANKREDDDVRKIRRARCSGGLQRALQNTRPHLVDSRVIKAVRGNRIIGFIQVSSYSETMVDARREQAVTPVPRKPSKKPSVEPGDERGKSLKMWTRLEAWAMNLRAMQDFVIRKYAVIASSIEEGYRVLWLELAERPEPVIADVELMAIHQDAFEERYIITRGLVHAVEVLAAQQGMGLLVFARADRDELFAHAGVFSSRVFEPGIRLGYFLSLYSSEEVAERVARRAADRQARTAGMNLDPRLALYPVPKDRGT